MPSEAKRQEIVDSGDVSAYIPSNVNAPKTLTPEEFKQALDERGLLRQVDAARALRCSRSAIHLYLKGKRPIPPLMVTALQGIRRLRRPVGNPEEPVGTSKD